MRTAAAQAPGVSPESTHAVRMGGRTVRMMRTLYTNGCDRTCGYCPFGRNTNIRRATWQTDELARVIALRTRAGEIEGAFITSGLAGSSVRMMDRMLEAAEILRRRHDYRHYLHLKILPGAQPAQIERALELADRVSVNLEAPTQEALRKIAPEKQLEGDLAQLARALGRAAERGRLPRAGWVTQFVVGPGGESDRTLLDAAQRLYRRHGLRRAYYSAFIPVIGTPLEGETPTDPLREHRLYQADWLMRFYGFDQGELPLDAAGHLPLHLDPKEAWAERHPALFPLEINRAERELLLRVPGLGPKVVERILRWRRAVPLRDWAELRRMGAATGRARRYAMIDGRFEPGLAPVRAVQLPLFESVPAGNERRHPADPRRIRPASGGTYQ